MKDGFNVSRTRSARLLASAKAPISANRRFGHSRMSKREEAKLSRWLCGQTSKALRCAALPGQ
jgi:hypothetical protein